MTGYWMLNLYMATITSNCDDYYATPGIGRLLVICLTSRVSPPTSFILNEPSAALVAVVIRLHVRVLFE
jgi:hypothetical protein